MARSNRCFNIDRFKGAGNGPQGEIAFESVTNILTDIGDSHGKIADGQFDLVFSISVVEHVPDDRLETFFKDCHRILSAHGQMIHLIDVYLENSPVANAYAPRRMAVYRSNLDGVLFQPFEPIAVKSDTDVRFSTSFASNPDNMMANWNWAEP